MPRDFLAASADRQSESLGFKSEEPPPEQFGNGMLIRPKVGFPCCLITAKVHLQ